MISINSHSPLKVTRPIESYPKQKAEESKNHLLDGLG